MDQRLTETLLVFGLPFPLALAIAWLLELAYRRAVVHGMRATTDTALAAPAPSRVRAPPERVVRPAAESNPPGDVVERISRGRRRVAFVHIGAGLMYAAATATLPFMAKPEWFSPMGYVLAFTFVSWPLLPTVWALARGGAAQLRSGLFVIGLAVATPLVAVVSTGWWALHESKYPIIQLAVQIVLAGIVMGAALTACLLVLWWLARVHRRGRDSAELLVIRWFWLASSLFNTLMGLVVYGCGGVLALVPYGLYRLQLAWTIRRAPETPTSLLVLRVFAGRRRREQLMRVIARDWTFVGPVRLIAGPDLATATLDASELFEFLTGRLSKRFVSAGTDVDEQLGRVEAHADGRYPVSELFCRESGWRPVLQALVRSSDVVMMDLRGFSAANQGAAYEITQLIDLFPLERVVFLVDQTTDRRSMEAAFAEAWRAVRPESPNAGRDVAPRFYETSGNPRALIAELARRPPTPARALQAS